MESDGKHASDSMEGTSVRDDDTYISEESSHGLKEDTYLQTEDTLIPGEDQHSYDNDTQNHYTDTHSYEEDTGKCTEETQSHGEDRQTHEMDTQSHEQNIHSEGEDTHSLEEVTSSLTDVAQSYRSVCSYDEESQSETRTQNHTGSATDHEEDRSIPPKSQSPNTDESRGTVEGSVPKEDEIDSDTVSAKTQVIQRRNSSMRKSQRRSDKNIYSSKETKETGNSVEKKCENVEKEEAKKKIHTEKGDCDNDDDTESRVHLKRELGLLNCVGLIMGNIIGSGIFVSPKNVLSYTGSIGMSLTVWAASGLMSMVGALCYAEIGAMIPQSGGSYTYLHEAFGPQVAFMQLWLAVMIGIPCSRAIGALTFAGYLIQPFFPDCQSPPPTALKLTAIMLIFLLTWINCRRVRLATKVQDVLALLKVLALIIIIVTGLHYLIRGNPGSLAEPWKNTETHPGLIATAFYHSLYAYDGWGGVLVLIEELKDPFRNMPRAIAISLTSVLIIYMLTNVAYFAVLSPQQILASGAVAVTFGNKVLGFVAWTIPLFVACSTAGSLNGSVMSGSRILFVGARRGHLPKVFTHVHVNNFTPVTSLVFMASISMIMFITSDLRRLINYISFAGGVMELAVIAAIFWFRFKQPDRHRPIKVWLGFPVIYGLMSIFLVIFPAWHQPLEVGVAALLYLSGFLVYRYVVVGNCLPDRFFHAMDKVTFVCQMLFQCVPEETTEEMNQKPKNLQTKLTEEKTKL